MTTQVLNEEKWNMSLLNLSSYNRHIGTMVAEIKGAGWLAQDPEGLATSQYSLGIINMNETRRGTRSL